MLAEEDMTPLFQGLAHWTGQAIGMVVHVGAGDGEVLDIYATLVPKHVLLIEGDADAAAELRAQTRHLPWAEVRDLVVAPTAGTVSWHRYSLRMLNGPLEPPLGLQAFYPRLRPLGRAEVSAVGFADLLAGLPARTPDDGVRLLVLNVPGQEGALLEVLSRPQLQSFDGVVLRGCSVDAPDVGAVTPRAIEQLVLRGFRRVESLVDAEPLWPVHVLSFDVASADLQEARDRLQAMEVAVSGAAAKARSEEARADALAIELELAQAGVAALQRALDQASEQAEQHRTRVLAQAQEIQKLSTAGDGLVAERNALVADRDALVAERNALLAERTALVAERDEQARLAQGRRVQMDAAFQERDAERARAVALQGQLDAVGVQRDELERQLNDQRAQTAAVIHERDDQAKHSRDQLARVSQELVAARQTASLSVKLQMLRESDLRDLQLRYQAALAQQQSQHELLTKLAQRLSLANQYFQQLSIEQQSAELVEGQAEPPQ